MSLLHSRRSLMVSLAGFAAPVCQVGPQGRPDRVEAKSGVNELYSRRLGATLPRPACVMLVPADGHIPRSNTPWPSVQRRTPLPARAQVAQGRLAPRPGALFVAAMPLRSSAKGPPEQRNSGDRTIGVTSWGH